MKKKKAKWFKKPKRQKVKVGTKLKEYNSLNYLEDYKLISLFSGVPKSMQDWIECTREDLKNKANMYECLLGEYLINKKIKFVHQAPFIINGKIYFLDFYIPKKRLAIEVDGQYHTSIGQGTYDEIRDYNFEKIGIKTIRIPNNATKSTSQLDILLLPLFG